jgi:hypothetical protein
MKWDKASKNKLYQVLRQKFNELEGDTPRFYGDGFEDVIQAVVAKKWEQFLDSFGISQEERFEEVGQYVFIMDPGPYEDYALKIPKEVAEKLLVLGTP